jgi:hypothetical protein
MSTLVAQTISNGTVSTSSANVIQGSAKAWVNFNGTGTVAIRASYNVSSITDNGSGNYTVNFTNAFADTNYVLVSSGATADSDFRMTFPNYNTVPATGSCQICTGNSYNVNSPLSDTPYIRAAFFR